MTLTVIKYPKTELADGHECKFSNGFNSLYVDVVRQDYAITGSTADSGYLRLYVADSSVFSLNQKIYYAGLDVNGDLVNSGSYKIWALGTGYISILELATSPDIHEIVSGTINEISDTKREVEITGDVSDGTNSYSFTARRFSYNSSGEVRIYLNALIKSIFTKRYTIDETVHNEKQTGVALILDNIFCKDINTDTEITLLDETYLAVKSIAQLGEDNRLVDYEVYNNGTINSTAKFMTAFKKPVYFEGYPHTIMALIGKNTQAVSFRHDNGVVLETYLNISGMGVYKIKVAPVGTEQSFKISLVTGTSTSGLAIDDTHGLDIDTEGNNLNLD